jgi:hypothetical protein
MQEARFCFTISSKYSLKPVPFGIQKLSLKLLWFHMQKISFCFIISSIYPLKPAQIGIQKFNFPINLCKIEKQLSVNGKSIYLQIPVIMAFI